MVNMVKQKLILESAGNDASALTCRQCCYMYLETRLQHSHACNAAACLLELNLRSEAEHNK